MVSLAVGLIVFACTFGGAMFALMAHPRLPRAHMTKEAQEAIRLSTGVIATLAAVILGLLITDVKTSFDEIGQDVQRFGTSLILLDQTLRDWGTPMDQARKLLREYTERAIQDDWPADSAAPIVVNDPAAYALMRQVGSLVRKTEPVGRVEKIVAQEAIRRYDVLLALRWRLIAESETTVSVPILIMLILMLTISFAGFGFNAPRNGLVVGSLAFCAAAVALAMFMTVEMDGAFTGMIRVSGTPVELALAHESH